MELQQGPNDAVTCKRCVLEELKPENVAPCHDNTRLFVDSQWTIGSKMSSIYLVYRLIIAVLLVAWIVSDFLDEAGRWYSYDYGLWLIFATNWSMIFVTILSVIMAFSTLYYFIRSQHHKQDLSKPIGIVLSVQWVVYNIAYNSAIVVSLSYWSFVLLYDINEAQDFLLTPMSQLKHSLNTVYIIVDLFSNAIPIRVYHLVYPLLSGVVYSIFNAAYFLNDHRGPDGMPFAYAAMDWRHPLGSTITCLLGFLLSCVVQLLLYGLYRLRCVAHRRLTKAVDADVDGYRQMTCPAENGGTGQTSLPAVLNDDERGPIFPNGFDAGGEGALFSSNGYHSIDTVEHSVNDK